MRRPTVILRTNQRNIIFLTLTVFQFESFKSDAFSENLTPTKNEVKCEGKFICVPMPLAVKLCEMKKAMFHTFITSALD
jgi:hypothetical protein